MQKRVKSLVAILMSCVIYLQMLPMYAQAAMSVSSTTYLLTETNLTDGYILGSGATLQFDENLTVDGYVEFGYGSGTPMYLIIPSTATMNGEISFMDDMGIVQNAGTITSEVNYVSGTVENAGKMARVVVSSGGMLKVFDGASFDALDMTAAGSGMVITEGSCSVGTLQLDPYGFSVVDSSSTQMNISNAVSFTGETSLDEKFKISVSDATAITTEGQPGLSVWKDGVKYPLPETVLNGSTLGDIYAVSADKTTLSFKEQAIGYQTQETATFQVTNDGMVDVTLSFATGGEWDTMFKVVSSAQEITSASTVNLAAGDTASFQVTMKTGLPVATHTGTFNVICGTSDVTSFETLELSSNVVVAKKSSIAVPSGDFYTLSGTAGKNGFYTSDVKVTPVTGYLIAEKIEDTFADSLTYTASVDAPSVYLQKSATGQITEKATLKAIKIDKVKPEIRGCEASKTYYADSISVTVKDDNLNSATLNTKALAIKNQTATTTLTAGDDTTAYTIVAEDLAGNSKSIAFKLAPAWRKNGLVPGGKSIKLYKNKKYTLGSGTWTVSGDTTSYAGGNAFYVESDGNYTFGTSN